MSLGTSRSNAGSEVVANGIGNQKLCVLRPSVVALGEADFLFAQRLAMSRGGILPVRGTVSDVASRIMKVGRPLVLRNMSTARSIRSISLASPTRRTFQP